MRGSTRGGAVSVSPSRFRRVLARLAGGVAVVTARELDGTPRGMTATSVCSVSLEPPLVLACLDVGAHTHEAVRLSGHYALNFLGQEDMGLAVRFAGDAEDKFDGLSFETAVTGAPLLEGVLGWCDCRVERALEAGDHTVFIGRVLAAEVRDDPSPRPLVYYLGRYRSLVERAAEAARTSEVERAAEAPAADAPPEVAPDSPKRPA